MGIRAGETMPLVIRVAGIGDFTYGRAESDREGELLGWVYWYGHTTLNVLND